MRIAQNAAGDRRKTRSVGVLLFDGFSVHCLAGAVEPLRAANMRARAPLYEWTFLAPTAQPVTSSSGLPVTPAMPLSAHPGGALLLVLPSYGFEACATPPLLRSLRAARSRFASVAGLDMGAWLMAAAGLLDGRRATVHWDEQTRFAERFPEVETVPDRCVDDPVLPTCGGGETALELMQALIARHHGALLAQDVAALFQHGLPRAAAPPRASRITAHAAALMRRNLETPLSIPQIAAALQISRRRLEHRFQSDLGQSPAAHYRHLRLTEARHLAETTRQSIAEIATRCGYDDPSALTRAYRAAFGLTPTDSRNR